ncbi:MAG: nuclear transport factor 2 family protein [Gemmatimonadota bacterium]
MTLTWDLPARPLAWPVVVLVVASLAACEPAQQASVPGDDDVTADVRPSGSFPYEPTGAERHAILEPLQTLFDALEAGDAELLRSVVRPGTTMVYAETRDGVTTQSTVTLDQLAERIESSTVPLIERMWSPVVMRRGPVATIWTPYDFYNGEEFSHCGIDAATLLREDGAWKIVGLSWTRDEPPRCDLHPDGPPSG